MKRREFLQSSAAVMLARPAPPRPNIVLVLADDMTWNCCEPYGSREVHTPNMARLAGEGVCFDGMSTATAMCSPTRQQLYTGMYPVRNGAFPNHSRVYDGVRSLPHHFRDLGYRVALTGKTHFAPPASYPFEYLGRRNADPNPRDMSQAASFIERDRRQPFFLVVASLQPHAPLNVGDPAAYPPEKLTVPPNLVDCPDTRQWLSKYYAEISYLDQQLGTTLSLLDNSGQRDNTIVIFSSEQGSPAPFGKWTCYEAGLKTAFIVRWPGKVRAGTRRKALAQYVDVLPTLLEAVGGNPQSVDTGRPDAHGKNGFDGSSFLPVLLGARDTHRDHSFGVHTTRGIIEGSPCYPVRSVRSRRFKYIRNLRADAEFSCVTSASPEGHIQQWLRWGKTHPEAVARASAYIKRPAEEFYDLDVDPYELKNTAADPANARLKAALSARMESWMEQQGDLGVETEMKADTRQPRAGGKIE